MRSLRNNVGIPAHAGFIPSGLPSHNEDKVTGYSYDPRKARSLLDSCSYQGEEIVITTNNDYLDICTFVASQWESVGINCRIDLKESAVLRDGMRKSNIPLFRASWIADYPDGESFLCMFYSKNPAPPNYTRFNSMTFDRLYEQALQESNTEKRMDLYQQMDRIIVEEAPVVFLFYDESAVFYSKDIQGFRNNGLNLLNIDFNKSGKR
jgi:peptide/nickel transport system substrate-binding protein